MLLTTGIVALSRKAKDERERKKEAGQGKLSVGPSDVAKRAFEGQTQPMLEAGPAPRVERTGTDIKYDHPSDVGAPSPDEKRGVEDMEKPAVQETRRAEQLGVSNPVQSEIASSSVGSPMDQTLTNSTSGIHEDAQSRPPTYVSRAESSSTSARSPSSFSRDDTLRTSVTESSLLSPRSTNSVGTHAVRVKTRGAQLSSGFDYHPALFDWKVHPEQWTKFTEQIVRATKVGASESGKAWAAATATAMSGAVLTSVFLKKYMDRAYQEKKIKAGISDMSDGGLGSTLRSWNDDYFGPQGLFVHLELSASAMKNEEQRSKTFRKPAMLYSKREDRQRKGEERKYVIVVTRLDADGAPTEAIREIEGNERETGTAVVAKADEAEGVAEMPGDTYQGFLIPELPGDDGLGMAELPGGVSLGFSSEKSMQPPPGFAELEPDEVTAQSIAKEMEDTSLMPSEKGDGSANDANDAYERSDLHREVT